MTASTRVGIYGTGRTAAELLAALDHAPFTLTAGVVHSSHKAGLDLGELTGRKPTGMLTTDDLDAVLAAGDIDVLLFAGLNGERHEQAMMACASAGIDQVHACFVDPREALAPQTRERIESAARVSGSRIVGTGMIPGLWLDVVPALLTSGLPAPVSIRGRRVSNISSWGRDVLGREIGIGTTASGLSPRVYGLLRQSARLIADVLQLDDRELVSEGGLVSASSDTRVAGIDVARGQVEGFDQSVVLVDGDAERLRLEWAGFAASSSRSNGRDTDIVLTLTGGDSTELIVRITPPLDPYPGTAARMLQATRSLRSLPGGLHPPTALAVG